MACVNLKTIITTSRNPSSGLCKFTKKIQLTFPFSKKINRGNLFLKSLIRFCLTKNITTLLLIYESKNSPNCLVFFHFPSGPTLFFRLTNLTQSTCKKILKFSKQYPLVFMDNFRSPIGKRLSSVFLNLFPVPDLNSNRIIFFGAKKNFVLFRHYWIEKKDFDVKFFLYRIFPVFDMFLFKISLGILFNKKAITEWEVNLFMNNFKKNFIF